MQPHLKNTGSASPSMKPCLKKEHRDLSSSMQPHLKKTEMSDPMSPDHCSICAVVAGFPSSSLAAHIVVAALPEPPPSPAPAIYEAEGKLACWLSQQHTGCSHRDGQSHFAAPAMYEAERKFACWLSQQHIGCPHCYDGMTKATSQPLKYVQMKPSGSLPPHWLLHTSCLITRETLKIMIKRPSGSLPPPWLLHPSCMIIRGGKGSRLKLLEGKASCFNTQLQASCLKKGKEEKAQAQVDPT